MHSCFPIELGGDLLFMAVLDGYNRVIVYLACSIDNTSATVLKLFEEAVVTGDCHRESKEIWGVKNHVWHYMLSHLTRGPSRGSYITGRSVHNSRIEQLWKYVYQGNALSFL